MRRRVRRLVESDLPQSTAPRLEVRATVTRAADNFVLSLTIETPSGVAVRKLRAHDCSVLSESAAVLVALASAPEDTGAERGASSSAAPPPISTESPISTEPNDGAGQRDQTRSRPTSASTSQDTTPSAPRTGASNAASREALGTVEPRDASPSSQLAWATRISLGAGVFANGLPGPRPDLFGEAALDVLALSASVRVGHVFGGAHSLPANSRARYFSDYLALTGCARWGTRRVVAGPCLALVGSRNHVATQGLVDGQNRTELWAQGGLGASLRFRLFERGELGLESGVLVPISARPQFDVKGLGALERGNVVSGYSHIDVGVRFE